MTQLEGAQRPLDDILAGTGVESPSGLLSRLTVEQRTFGECLFRLAFAFILLHELAHLHYRHERNDDTFWNKEQEKDADRFAAEWLTDSTQTQEDRMGSLFGIAVALLWLILFDVFLGPRQSKTHPPAYDRLYQVLDQVVDSSNKDEELVLDFVFRILYLHCDAARIQVEAGRVQGSPKERVNYMMDLISKKSPW